MTTSASAQSEADYCETHWWGVGRCWHGPHRHRPRLTASVELGAGAFVEGGPFGFGSGTGSVVNAGPSYGLRVGVDFLPWIGLEGRWVGAYLPGARGDFGYVMNGGEAVVRLAIPTPYVRPYIFGGIGFYDFALVGSGAAASELVSASQSGVPMGLGVEVMLTWHLSFAVEGAFRFQIGESFSANEDIAGADVTTLSGVMRARF
ncbi:MAG TPA: hypothetical protein VGH28_15965 [Polyangiaceae bacterium]